MSGQVYRPSQARALGDAMKRIRALEAVSMGSYGIQFNSLNDAIADRWLDVTTTDVDADGNSIKIVATPGGGGAGDVVFGFPVDGSGGGYSGMVRFGVGYGGDRTFRFEVDDDLGGTWKVFSVDDIGIHILDDSSGVIDGIQYAEFKPRFTDPATAPGLARLYLVEEAGVFKFKVNVNGVVTVLASG